MNVDAMKAMAEEEWTAMPEDYVCSISRTFGPCEAMVDANGGHFEK